ncbi:hypothetical protein Tco_0469062 [Tanacetum coccineum]
MAPGRRPTVNRNPPVNRSTNRNNVDINSGIDTQMLNHRLILLHHPYERSDNSDGCTAFGMLMIPAPSNQSLLKRSPSSMRACGGIPGKFKEFKNSTGYRLYWSRVSVNPLQILLALLRVPCLMKEFPFGLWYPCGFNPPASFLAGNLQSPTAKTHLLKFCFRVSISLFPVYSFTRMLRVVTLSTACAVILYGECFLRILTFVLSSQLVGATRLGQYAAVTALKITFTWGGVAGVHGPGRGVGVSPGYRAGDTAHMISSRRAGGLPCFPPPMYLGQTRFARAQGLGERLGDGCGLTICDSSVASTAWSVRDGFMKADGSWAPGGGRGGVTWWLGGLFSGVVEGGL